MCFLRDKAQVCGVNGNIPAPLGLRFQTEKKQTLRAYSGRGQQVTCHIKNNVDIVECVDVDDTATFVLNEALE
ncbi:hypothetical protein EVAR_3622_1 [Eumeta japonica]|uniref:Uncharacterized protein n=1 Tax=Eumeta variegata TaxID=151549 RepID=A0A4C1SVN7_EUMVA|nr:hypothetical protein EVAR_3622_1 [Eumeta japonica]